MLNPQLNPADAALDGLATYIAAQVPALTVYREWPYANQKLVYPTVTLSQGKVTVMNRQPEQIAITTPDVDGKVTITEVVGEVDFKIQMDIWASDKYMRDTQLGNLLAAINAQMVDTTGKNKPAGLSLQLTNYFNDWVRFDLDAYETVDDEAAAQRQERRAKIDLLVNCRIIRQRTLYAIQTIAIELGVTTKSNEMNPDITYTDEVVIVD